MNSYFVGTIKNANAGENIGAPAAYQFEVESRGPLDYGTIAIYTAN